MLQKQQLSSMKKCGLIYKIEIYEKDNNINVCYNVLFVPGM